MEQPQPAYWDFFKQLLKTTTGIAGPRQAQAVTIKCKSKMKHYREMHTQFDDPIGEGETAVAAPSEETAPAAAEGQE